MTWSCVPISSTSYSDSWKQVFKCLRGLIRAYRISHSSSSSRWAMCISSNPSTFATIPTLNHSSPNKCWFHRVSFNWAGSYRKNFVHLSKKAVQLVRNHSHLVRLVCTVVLCHLFRLVRVGDDEFRQRVSKNLQSHATFELKPNWLDNHQDYKSESTHPVSPDVVPDCLRLPDNALSDTFGESITIWWCLWRIKINRRRIDAHRPSSPSGVPTEKR